MSLLHTGGRNAFSFSAIQLSTFTTLGLLPIFELSELFAAVLRPPDQSAALTAQSD